MNERLFRKKSIDRVSSPEQLNEYIRVTTPGVWIVLAAIMLLLVGVCVWGIFGHLDTTLSTVAIAENGEMTLYVKEGDIPSVKEGMKVTVGGVECTVTEIASVPVSVDGTFTDYAMHVGGLYTGEWVYAVKVSGTIADGVHSAEIVIESISPMSFVLN